MGVFPIQLCGEAYYPLNRKTILGLVLVMNAPHSVSVLRRPRVYDAQWPSDLWCNFFETMIRQFFTFFLPVLYPEICYILAYAFCYRRDQFGALLQTISPKQKPGAFSVILDILCKELTRKSIGAKLLVLRSHGVSAATGLCYRTAWQGERPAPLLIL